MRARSGVLLAGALCASLLGLLLAGGVSSCVSQSTTGALSCPREDVFTGNFADGGVAVAAVSTFMERRCGTLDCHGSDDKPMRLYGRFGLRDPGETNFSGGAATTLRELAENYTTLCLLQPEETSTAVANQGQSAESLLIVTKARGLEAHKGGQVVQKGSPGDNCIAGWLRGDAPAMVAGACKTAIGGL